MGAGTILAPSAAGIVRDRMRRAPLFSSFSCPRFRPNKECATLVTLAVRNRGAPTAADTSISSSTSSLVPATGNIFIASPRPGAKASLTTSIIGASAARAAQGIRFSLRTQPEATAFVATGTVTGATVGAVPMIEAGSGAVALSTKVVLQKSELRGAIGALPLKEGTAILGTARVVTRSFLVSPAETAVETFDAKGTALRDTTRAAVE